MERERGMHPLISDSAYDGGGRRRRPRRDCWSWLASQGNRHRVQPGFETLETRVLLSGTFTALVHSSPNASGTMMLASDGSVLMEGGGVTNTWYRLAPDSSGSYVDGTWSQVASMALDRIYFGSVVLPDGDIMVEGGEYSGPLDQENDSNAGEIYDPVTNSWSPIAAYPEPSFGDDCLEVLPDGSVLAGYLNGPQTFLYDPATNTWSPGPTKLLDDASDEENWVKLPGGDILSYDIDASIATGVGHAQYYDPTTNTWNDAGIVPVALSSAANGNELGAGVLLPDGQVFYLGGTGNTAYYNPASNSWTAGPAIPEGLVCDDAPAANLPDGDVLFTADTPLYTGPAHLFEFNPNTNTYTDLTSSLPSGYLNGPSYLDRMLVLPTGQVLMNNGSSQLSVFTPSQAPVASGVPAITGLSENPDGSYLLSGTVLNGISEGAYYGDDAQMSSNYPLVRLTDASNDVYYARTYNWSSTGVATGIAPETTDFTLPPGLPPNKYAVQVIANGFASNPVSLTIPAVANDPAPAIISPATASSNPVTGTTAVLSVTASDPVEGASTLMYTWAAAAVPAGATPPSFSTNNSNAAQNDTVTFDRAGTYTFQVTVTNLAGLSSISSVTLTVNQTASSITVSPSAASVAPGTSQQFSATVLDQFGVMLSVEPSVTWSLTAGKGSLSSTGLYTAPTGGTGTLATVTATMASAAGSVSGSTLAYVLSSDWSSQDIGGAAFNGAAGDNGAGTFGLAGSGAGIAGVTGDGFRYVFQSVSGDCAITAQLASQQSLSPTGIAAVMIRNDLTASAAMAAMGITAGGDAGFLDRSTASTASTTLGTGPSPPPSWIRLVRSGNTFTGYESYDGVTWTEAGSATIAMGTSVDVGLAVTSASFQVLDTALFDQVSIETAPTVVAAASAAPNPVTGTSAIVTVLGGDILGEAALTYTWTATPLGPALPNPAFAINGTNAARNDTVTFQQAGSYTLTVSITNQVGFSTTTSVTVIVVQTIASIDVTPGTASLSTAGSALFQAVAYDQFGQALVNQPAFTWTVAPGGIGGTIGAGGLYTRPSPGVGDDTVLASAGGLSGAATVTVTAAAATQLVVTGEPPAGLTAGQSFGFAVSAEDPFGNVDPTFGSSLTITPVGVPAGSLGGALTATATQGVAAFSGLTLDHAGLGITLAASATGLEEATTIPLSVAAAAATQLAVLVQPPASVTAGSGFGLTVAAEDAFGNINTSFAGSVSLAPASLPPGARLGGVLIVTASGGVAKFVGLTLGTASSADTLQVTSTGLAPATTNPISVTPAAASQLVLLAQPPASVMAGSAFDLVVEAEDPFGNAVTAFSGSVALDPDNNPGSAALSGTTSVIAVLGVARFTNLILDTAGIGYTLLASSSGVTPAETNALTVNAAMATQLVLTPAPASSITAGSGFGLTVLAEDPYGNLDLGFMGSVTVGLVSDPTGALLNGMRTVTASAGVAAFSNLTLDTADTGYTLQAAGSGLTPATAGPFRVGPAAAARLEIATQPPSSVVAGSPFGLVVVTEDAYGNLTATSSGSVTLSVTLTNNQGAGGTTPGGMSSAAISLGTARFSGVLLDHAATGYLLTAASGALTADTTDPIVVTAAPATQLVVVAQPPSLVTAGAGFPVTVAAEDPYGNIDPTFQGGVTVSLAANPAGDSVVGGSSATTVAGLVSFSGLTLTRAASGDTLEASSGALNTALTDPIRVTAAAATQLLVTSEPPPSVIAGSTFDLTVTAVDPYGNTDLTFAGKVTLSLANPPGGSASGSGAGLTLAGTMSAVAAGGVAAFTGAQLDQAGSGFTLQATAGSLGPALTSVIAVGPAASAQLAIVTPPASSVTAGGDFSLVVAVEDAYGNVTPAFAGSVSLALDTNPAGDTLGGNPTVPVTAGLAHFADLTLDKAVARDTLRAASAPLSPVETSAITVTAAAATQLVIATQPPAAVTAGAAFTLRVEAEDPFGNLATSYTGPVNAVLNSGPAGATLGGPASVTADAGLATFSGLILTRASSGDLIQVSSGIFLPITSNSCTVVSAHATHLAVTTEPPADVVAGQDFSLVVQAEDPYGNTDTTFAAPVGLNLASAPTGAFPGAPVTVLAGLGVARFSGLLLDTAGVGYTLQAASSGVNDVLTSTFTVSAAGATHLVVTTPPPASVPAGSGFGLVVKAEDSYGNVDPAFVSSVALTPAGMAAGGVLGGTLDATAQAGVAAFAGLALFRAGGGAALQVSSSGLAGATTSPFAVTPLAASQLVFTAGPPSTVTAGDPFTVTVVAEDPFGNIDPSFDRSISLTLASNPGGSMFAGAAPLAADAGLANFSGLTLTIAASGYTLLASASGLPSAGSNGVTVSAAPATQLVVASEPPATINAGAPFALTVVAEDRFGNIDDSFAGNESLTVFSSPGGATLAGTLSVTSDAGVAQLSGITLDEGGAGDILEVVSNGLSPALTAGIDVIPPPAAVVSVSLQKQTGGRRSSHTVIVIQFSEALDDASAANLDSYTLATLPQGKTRESKPVALARAVYDPLTYTVTLETRKALSARRPLQLSLNASNLLDALGRPLDGSNDGRTGNDFRVTLH